MIKNIETKIPVANSKIWSIRADYYINIGTKAWSKGHVPQGTTSNCYIAGIYASIITEFIRDQQKNGIDKPVLILEIGGGNGRLALRILNSLYIESFPLLDKPPKFKYLLTDASIHNVTAWQKIKKFEKFVDWGVLDFGELLVGKDFSINTIHNETIDEESIKNIPVIIISNYLFCSIPSDLVRIENGKIYEQLITLNEEFVETDEKRAFRQLKYQIEDGPEKNAVSEHTLIQKVFEKYRKEVKNAFVPFSMSGVWFLDLFLKRENPLLLLYGDLGFTAPHQFRKKAPFIFDKGYFACRTNLHLIGEQFKENGGNVVFGRSEDSHFQVAAFYRKGKNHGNLAHTAIAAKMLMKDYAPFDVYCTLKMTEKKSNSIKAREIFGLIRLSKYDPAIADNCFASLERIIMEKKNLNRNELFQVFSRVAENIYPNDRSRAYLDIKIALLFINVGLLEQAKHFLEQSIAEQGVSEKRTLVLNMINEKMEEE